MKNKLTLRFLTYSVISTILVFVLSSLIIHFIYSRSASTPEDPKYLAEVISQYIVFSNDQIRLTDDGKKHLNKNGAWLQVLNKEGLEIYNYQKPSDIATSYLPYEIAEITHKSIDGKTVFVSGYNDMTVLITFPRNQIQKISFEISSAGFFLWVSLTLIVSFSGSLIYLIMTRLFIKKLTGPISLMMMRIKQIGDFSSPKGENVSSGLYQEVFNNLNELEDKIEAAKENIQLFDRKRNEWIENISHDIRTPLSSIKGYAALMADHQYTFSKEEQNNYSEVILKNADAINNLVNNLSLEMKLINNKSPLSLKRMCLNDVIRDEISSILSDKKYSDRDVSFLEEKKIESNIDPILFQRAINNIIINALKYSAETSSVHISLREDPDGRVAISISDNGKGMTEKELRNLFTRYFRGENAQHTEGSGLGMPIAKNIIEAHSGTISVESEPGRGTTVIILLQSSNDTHLLPARLDSITL